MRCWTWRISKSRLPGTRNGMSLEAQTRSIPLTFASTPKPSESMAPSAFGTSKPAVWEPLIWTASCTTTAGPFSTMKQSTTALPPRSRRAAFATGSAAAESLTETPPTGTDIYHWRFGPRASTRRNLDYYFWGWSNPESVPWGYQVQDGGAVLGFSFHDLMCRLKVDGPDDAWARLQQILAWFDETQAEGGYRRYYAKDPSRGTMQGGNVPGGLGLDREFFESVLVPQVMLYGFLGFEPTPGGFKIEPRLPKDWPELTITRVHLHDLVLSITAKATGTIELQVEGASDLPLVVELPDPKWKVAGPPASAPHRSMPRPLGGRKEEFQVNGQN